MLGADCITKPMKIYSDIVDIEYLKTEFIKLTEFRAFSLKVIPRNCWNRDLFLTSTDWLIIGKEHKLNNREKNNYARRKNIMVLESGWLRAAVLEQMMVSFVYC